MAGKGWDGVGGECVPVAVAGEVVVGAVGHRQEAPPPPRGDNIPDRTRPRWTPVGYEDFPIMMKPRCPRCCQRRDVGVAVFAIRDTDRGVARLRAIVMAR